MVIRKEIKKQGYTLCSVYNIKTMLKYSRKLQFAKTRSK